MVLKENYNSASQKYGKEMTDEFLKLGLPPNFLLSACRFKSENNRLKTKSLCMGIREKVLNLWDETVRDDLDVSSAGPGRAV